MSAPSGSLLAHLLRNIGIPYALHTNSGLLFLGVKWLTVSRPQCGRWSLTQQ